MTEGNRELAGLVCGKTVDMQKLKICQTKIDMGLKRKAELDNEVSSVEKQLGTVQKKLKM